MLNLGPIRYERAAYSDKEWDLICEFALREARSGMSEVSVVTQGLDDIVALKVRLLNA